MALDKEEMGMDLELGMDTDLGSGIGVGEVELMFRSGYKVDKGTAYGVRR